MKSASNVLMFKNLDQAVTATDLSDLITKYGHLKCVKIITTSSKAENTQVYMGIVVMDRVEDAFYIKESLNNHNYKNHCLEIHYCSQRVIRLLDLQNMEAKSTHTDEELRLKMSNELVEEAANDVFAFMGRKTSGFNKSMFGSSEAVLTSTGSKRPVQGTNDQPAKNAPKRRKLQDSSDENAPVKNENKINTSVNIEKCLQNGHLIAELSSKHPSQLNVPEKVSEIPKDNGNKRQNDQQLAQQSMQEKLTVDNQHNQISTKHTHENKSVQQQSQSYQEQPKKLVVSPQQSNQSSTKALAVKLQRIYNSQQDKDSSISPEQSQPHASVNNFQSQKVSQISSTLPQQSQNAVVSLQERVHSAIDYSIENNKIVDDLSLSTTKQIQNLLQIPDAAGDKAVQSTNKTSHVLQRSSNQVHSSPSKKSESLHTLSDDLNKSELYRIKLQEDVDILREKLDKQQKKIEMKDKSVSFNSEISSMHDIAKISELTTALSSIQKERSEYLSRNKLLQTEVIEANHFKSRLVQDKESLTKHIQLLEAGRQKVEETTKKETSDLNAAINILRTQLAESEKIVGQWKAKHNDVLVNLKNSQTQLTEYKLKSANECEDLTKRNKEYENKLLELTKETSYLRSIESESESLKSTLEHLRAENSRLEKSCYLSKESCKKVEDLTKKIQTDKNKVETECVDLKRKVGACMNDLDNAKKQIDALKLANSAFEREQNSLKDQLKIAEQNFKATKGSLDQITHERNDLVTKLTKTIADNEKNVLDRQALDKRIQTSMSDCTKLKNQHAKLSEEYNSALNVSKKYENQIKELCSRIAELESRSPAPTNCSAVQTEPNMQLVEATLKAEAISNINHKLMTEFISILKDYTQSEIAF